MDDPSSAPPLLAWQPDPLALAALLLSLAAWLLMPTAAAGLRRLDTAPTPGPRWWARLSEGREGCPAPHERHQVAITAAAIGAVVALGLGASWAVPLAGAIPGLVAYVGSGHVRTAAHRQRTARLRADLPGSIELMASCLRAGLPLRNAAAAVAEAYGGPVEEDLGAVLARIRIGDSESRAWAAWRDHPQWGPVARDLARSVDSGTALVDTLGDHASRARERYQADVVARARATGVRSVLPMMACYLPAFLAIGIVPIVIGSLTSIF